MNFRNRRYNYTTLDFDPALSCRCLALSDFHLAVGFEDGTVRLFDLATRLHVSTCLPHHNVLLGAFSRAVSGIILSRARLVFASLYGDVNVAALDTVAPLDPVIPTRHVHLGQGVNDGALVDFAGCSRWWVGLYAGAPGQAFRIWDGETEEPVFVGGSLTDPEAVMGWHMFTELTNFVGRVRVTSQESAVACTSRRVIVFNLRNGGNVHGEQEFAPGFIVGSLDANNEAYVIVDGRGVASVRRAENLEEVCRFVVGGTSQRRVLGCMNGGYALMCIGSVIRAWEVERGVYLYNLRERTLGDLVAMVADDRYVAACNSDTTIHLWDFGAQ